MQVHVDGSTGLGDCGATLPGLREATIDFDGFCPWPEWLPFVFRIPEEDEALSIEVGQVVRLERNAVEVAFEVVGVNGPREFLAVPVVGSS